MIKKLIMALFVAIFSVSCQDESSMKDLSIQSETPDLIGDYHNEILKNFIVYYSQDVQSTGSNTSDFVQIMANYGVAVLKTYKNDPPSSNIDKWIEGVLNKSLDSTQLKIIEILGTGRSMSEAIEIVFGADKISSIVKSYLIELNRTIDQYKGTPSFQDKVNIIRARYYGSASQDDRTIITWTSILAKGSHEYWNQECNNWNPSLKGRFWDFGKRVLVADAIGGLEYILATKIGLIAGPISWKIGAAYAALNSVLAGVEDILLNTQSRSSITEETIKNISKEEIYKAYLKRKAELGIN
jgi:hypothetical protein